MKGTSYEKAVKRLGRSIVFMVCLSSLVWSRFIDNSTLYFSLSANSTIITNNDVNLEDDYKYSLGVRKIALFPYQSRSRFYTGSETALSDKANIGAVNGWEYLFNVDGVRLQGNEFTDTKIWLKWSSHNFTTKLKYENKESRDLEYVQADFRWRKSFWFMDFTTGYALRGHPVYNFFAIDDYNGMWWDLAYEYGYQDFLVPVNDLNENGIIDDYYVWIETDPETEDGYWIYYYEGSDYFWEDANGNAVAYSDTEFLQYHYPHIVDTYNEDNQDKSYQFEILYVVGLDMYFGGETYYTHLWCNLFPKTYGITDKAYEGDEMQYDIGMLIGTNINDKIGLFLEGDKLNYYGREEYSCKIGLNYKF